jgi:hypothetical protein
MANRQGTTIPIIQDEAVLAARQKVFSRPIFVGINSSASGVANFSDGSFNPTTRVNSPLEARLLSMLYLCKTPYGTGFLGSIPGMTASGLGVTTNSNLSTGVKVSAYRGSDFLASGVDMTFKQKMAHCAAARQKFASSRAGGMIPVTKSIYTISGNFADFETKFGTPNNELIVVPNPAFLGTWDAFVTRAAGSKVITVVLKNTDGTIIGKHIITAIPSSELVDNFLLNAGRTVDYAKLVPVIYADSINFEDNPGSGYVYVKNIAILHGDPLEEKSWPLFDFKNHNKWLASSLFTGYLQDEDQNIPVGRIINVRLKDLIASHVSYPVVYFLAQGKHDKGYLEFVANSNISTGFTQLIKDVYNTAVGAASVKTAFNTLKTNNTVENYLIFVDKVRAIINIDAPISYRY